MKVKSISNSNRALKPLNCSDSIVFFEYFAGNHVDNHRDELIETKNIPPFQQTGKKFHAF